jgi:AAA15 family ATPase/GTPase
MIRVKSVQISRFRGIREGKIEGFADVNLLVGRNNSGKSTVVEAIHRLAYSVPGNPIDPLGRGTSVWSGVRGEGSLYPHELWYALDQGQAISISAGV